MSKEEMEIKISPSGEIEISVMGAQGKECLNVSKFLEDSLGDVVKRKFKSEYYQEENFQTDSQCSSENQEC